MLICRDLYSSPGMGLTKGAASDETDKRSS